MRPADWKMLPFEAWLSEGHANAILHGPGSPELYADAMAGDECALRICRDMYKIACDQLDWDNARRAAESR